jgi:hypothetical protein
MSAMTAKDAIDLYLAEFTADPNSQVSYLEAGIRDARAARHGEPPALWLATIGFLIVVEQIGHTVSMPATAGTDREGSRSAFLAACTDFGAGTVDQDDADVLYSVRCALAHEYGLRSVPKNKNKEPFLFAYLGGGPLIQMRTVAWDGTAAGVTREATTQIGLNSVCDYVEDLVARVRTLHAAGYVVLVDGVTPDEVAGMLTFRRY